MNFNISKMVCYHCCLQFSFLMPDLSWNIAASQFGSVQFYLAQKQRNRIQDYSDANKRGEEAQKETIRLINIGLPQSIKV